MLRCLSDLGKRGVYPWPQGARMHTVASMLNATAPSRPRPQGQLASSHSAALSATSLSRKPFCSTPPTVPATSNSDHTLEHLRVRIEWQDLDVEGVHQFALNNNVPARDAGILKELQVAGPELSTMTERLLESFGVSQHSARMLMCAVQAQQPVVRSLGVRASSGHFFANRDGQIARLFALNARNNWMAGQCDNEPFTFAACLHLDGAGKTTLGHVYLDQLKTDAVRGAVKSELKALHPAGHGCPQSFIRNGLNQLDEMQNQVVSLTISAGETFATTMDVLFLELNHLLLETVEQSPNMAHQDTLDQLDRIRKRHPVYLMIDGCEAMQFAEFLQLRKWLADQFYDRWALQPFHVYLCGGPFQKQLDSAPATKCIGWVKHELLVLPPLEVQHIRGMAAHDFGITSDKLPLDACQEIAKVTGGFPSMIGSILELLPSISSELPITKEHVTAAARQVAGKQLGSNVAHLTDKKHLLKLVRLAVYEEMGSYLQLDKTVIWKTDQLTRLLCELPVLAKRQAIDGLYSVQCCPVYFMMLRDQLARLEPTSIQLRLKDERVLRQFRTPYLENLSDARKRRIITSLMQHLVPALLLERQPGGSAAGSPLTTSLAQWMPLLFGNLDSATCLALSDIVPDGGVEALMAHPFRVNLKPHLLNEPVNTYAQQSWRRLGAALGKEDVAKIAHYFRGFVIHMPASCSLRLVTCEVITKERSQCDNPYEEGPPPAALRAVRDIPRDMPHGSHQLLVLVADRDTLLQELIVGQCLVFTKGTAVPGAKEKRNARVVYPPELAKECTAGKDLTRPEDELDPDQLLEKCAHELPEGATVVVVSPELFRELSPPEKGDWV